MTPTSISAVPDGRVPPRPRAKPRAFDAFPLKLILPLVLMEAVLVIVPLLIGLYSSVHRIELLDIGAFNGLDNYRAVLASSEFLRSLAVTAVFSVFSLVLTFVVGLSLALLLERDSRWHIFGRAVVMVPYVISMLVGSMLLKWLFSADAGMVDLISAPFGFGDVSILADSRNAMAALVFNGMWRDSAFAMILLMAGLKNIPLQLYQAATVDGAGLFYRFRRITLPLLKRPILITVVRLLIHFINVLTFPLILTGGGPNKATATTGLALYQVGFVEFRFGEAQAWAMMIFVFNMVLVFGLVRLFRDRSQAP